VHQDPVGLARRHRFDHDLELAVIGRLAPGALHLDEALAQAAAIQVERTVVAHRMFARAAHRSVAGPGAAAHAGLGIVSFKRLARIESLGRHKQGKICIYVKSLADIEEDVLAEMVADACRAAKERCSDG
jgi:hypothetical protein